MRNDTDTSDETDGLTRRRAVGVLTAIASGGIALEVMTHPTAAVDTMSFNAADSSASVPYTADPAPELTATGEWSYENTDMADEVMTAVLVDGELLDSAERSTSGPSDSGPYERAGTLTDLRAYQPSDFAPPEDGQRTIDMTVEVRLEVRDPRGQTLADAAASDALTLTIDDSGVSVQAEIGGSASVSVPNSTSD
jgi:hypothetical protein